MDEAMKNVEIVLNLYKKEEINAEQAYDLLSGIYRSVSAEMSKSKTFEYFPSKNTTSTTWNG